MPSEAEKYRYRIAGIAVVQQQPDFYLWKGTRDLETFSSRNPLVSRQADDEFVTR
jgi:hypothetical protein